MLNNVVAIFGAPTPPVTSSYESIATVTVGAGGSGAITFSSIPSTYKHLQLRTFGGTGGGAADINITFNGDTASNYSAQLLYGTGASVGAYSPPTTASVYWSIGNSYGTPNAFGVAVTDILDYADTNKYKTTKSLYGYDTNGAGQLNVSSGNWRSTAAINSITITPVAATIIQYSSFALYGIKG